MWNHFLTESTTKNETYSIFTMIFTWYTCIGCLELVVWQPFIIELSPGNNNIIDMSPNGDERKRRVTNEDWGVLCAWFGFSYSNSGCQNADEVCLHQMNHMYANWVSKILDKSVNYVFQMHKIHVNKPRNRALALEFYPSQSIDQRIGIKINVY